MASKQILVLIALLPVLAAGQLVASAQTNPPIARLSHEYARGSAKAKANSAKPEAPITETTKPEASKVEASKGQTPKPEAKTTASETSAEAPKHKQHAHALPPPSLVPPPPPGAYLGSPFDFTSSGMISPEYQTPKQLKQSLSDLTDQLDRAGRALDAKQRASQERKDRATQFQSLYTEGVISRRELENAQADADTLDDGIKDLESKVQMLKESKVAVESRLNKIEKKTNKPSSDKAPQQKAASKTPAGQ